MNHGRIDGDPWRVVDDLPFLLAQDNSLHDEFAHVCAILMEGPTTDDSDESGVVDVPDETESVASSVDSGATAAREAAPSSRAARRKPSTANTSTARRRPHFELRQKQEMMLLRDQVEALKQQLNATQALEKRPTDMSMWEKAAKIECVEKHKVMHENEQLKQAVHQQATFIEHMEKLCRKKPRLTISDMHSEAWQSYRLAAHESLRVAAIHAIADRQYRRMQNAFIQAGVFGRHGQNIYRAQLSSKHVNTVLFELVNRMTLPAPFHVVGAAAWKVFNGEESPTWPDGTVETMEVVDACTVYSRIMQHVDQDGTIAHANMIRKRYMEADCDVVVSKTVLEDALVPHMSKGAVEDKCFWFEVAPSPTHPTTHCSMTFVMQLNSIVSPADDDDLLSAMRKITVKCNDHVPEEGSFEFAAAQVEPTEISSPALRGFVERGKLFVESLERTVNDAIQSHKALL